jgi:hypothetical protein
VRRLKKDIDGLWGKAARVSYSNCAVVEVRLACKDKLPFIEILRFIISHLDA